MVDVYDNGIFVPLKVTKEKLIKWVEGTAEGQKAFEESCGTLNGRNIQNYLKEYSHRNGIVRDLATDLDYPGDDNLPDGI